MTIPYISNIPFPTNSPSVDQPNMQTNTNSLESALQIDHEFFNTGANTGAHSRVQLRNINLSPYLVAVPGAPPSPIGAGYETLYSNPGATLALGELWYSRDASATGIQLTGPVTPNTSANGFTFLAGGLVLQWGTVTMNVGSTHDNVLVNFPTPFQNTCLSMTAVLNSASQAITLTGCAITIFNYHATDFRYIFNGPAPGTTSYPTFTWMAIGF